MFNTKTNIASGTTTEGAFPQVSPVGSDEQTINDLLKELDEQEVPQKKVEDNTSDSETIIPPTENAELVKKEKNDLKTANLEQIKKEEGKEASLGSLKKAKSNYEKLGQSLDEQKIVGATAIETYLCWVRESRKALKDAKTDEQREMVFVFIPKRVREWVEREGLVPASQSSTEENSEPQPKQREKKGEADLQERVRQIEERIKSLDQNRSEYPEERQHLETKKFLMEKETKKTPVDKDLKKMGNNLRLTQEKATQDLIDKQSFENTAPVVRPEKEEKSRLKKALAAEKLEEEEEKKPSDDVSNKLKPDQQVSLVKEEAETEDLTEKEEPAEETKQEAEVISQPEEVIFSFSEEKLQKAIELREGFYKELFSVDRSDWYQKPSINRDLVNKQIIQTAGVLSGKDSTQLDMNDIQTARLFMFNNAPKEILDHPAFSYVESFYNYQSFQGCAGVNPEKMNTKQSDINSISKKTDGVQSPFAERIFVNTDKTTEKAVH